MTSQETQINNALPVGFVLHGPQYSYEIIRVLGQGTFGITYLASLKISGALGSIDTETYVAIKEFFMKELNGREDSIVTSSSKDGAFSYYKTRFISEACNLGKLHHPNIIKVLELFEGNNTAYYAMEYVSAGSLDSLINTKKGLPERMVIKYALQIGNALAYMHSEKMLHLDLKPNNIMLQKDGNAVLIDFGLSKQFDENGLPESSTTIGHGTPGYAPIEQANYRADDKKNFPATMDVYAFGATIFKMITGYRPPEASLILNDGFPTDIFSNHKCSAELLNVIKKCMEPLKKDRFQTISDSIKAMPGSSGLEDEDTTINKGFYKRKIGEEEYGTFRVQKIPVTTTIEFPKFINIKLWSKDSRGLSYEFSMPYCSGNKITNLVKIWHDGKLVDEHYFGKGIPNDVKQFIEERGFLSTEHWENESTTTPIGKDFGFDICVEMVDKNQNIYNRRVENAHPDWHNLLLEEVKDLVNSTSLAKEIKSKQWTNVFKAPSDVYEIFVEFSPCQIGCVTNPNKGFRYSFRLTGANPIGVNPIGLEVADFTSLIREINDLNIEVGALKQDKKDYSEIPGKLYIYYYSEEKGCVLSLTAFNSDMIAGNIYNANIFDLANSLNKICSKYAPKKTEPTQELIYSIPDSTYKNLLSNKSKNEQFTLKSLWKNRSLFVNCMGILAIMFYGFVWLLHTSLITGDFISEIMERGENIRILVYILLPYIGLYGVVKLMYANTKFWYVPLILYLLILLVAMVTIRLLYVELIYILILSCVYAIYYWVVRKNMIAKGIPLGNRMSAIGFSDWPKATRVVTILLIFVLFVGIICVGSNFHIEYYRFAFWELAAISFCAYQILKSRIIGLYLAVPILLIGYAANFLQFNGMYSWIVEQSITIGLVLQFISIWIKIKGKNALNYLR